MNGALTSLGGLGLFLLGMGLMTSGLRHLVGDRLQRWLAAATRTPLHGVAVGTGLTAVMQSSSATTVAAVGLVGAGLITFPQAFGVILGANIGTTVTGWMVALIGFELELATLAHPLLFVAAVLYLFKERRALRASGKALAGFAMVFLGIELLGQGLSGAAAHLDLSGFDAAQLGDRVKLLLLGGLLTLLTQSSSATVAAALTALHGGVVDLPQACALIIGADVGTTATAGLATIGGSTGSRRTGMAHVIYNMITGVFAFAALPLYLSTWAWLAPDRLSASPEVVAVGFHSFFNIMGVVLALPVTGPFTRLIVWIFPDREEPLTRALDEGLLASPPIAALAVAASARRLCAAALELAADALRGAEVNEQRRAALAAGIVSARRYAIRAGAGAEPEESPAELQPLLYMLDHAERISDRLGARSRAVAAQRDPDLLEAAAIAADRCRRLASELNGGGELRVAPELAEAAEQAQRGKGERRRAAIEAALAGGMDAAQVDATLDAHRWLLRIGYHAWRIADHAGALRPLPGAPEASASA